MAQDYNAVDEARRAVYEFERLPLFDKEFEVGADELSLTEAGTAAREEYSKKRESVVEVRAKRRFCRIALCPQVLSPKKPPSGAEVPNCAVNGTIRRSLYRGKSLRFLFAKSRSLWPSFRNVRFVVNSSP